MSSASAPDPSAGAPAVAPVPIAPRPSVVPPSPRRKRPVRVALAAFLILAGLAAVAIYVKTRARQGGPSGTTTATIRTAPVLFGDLQRTVRLTGTVQAEKFAAIMAPQLHGSHSDRGRGGGPTGNAQMSVTTVQVSSIGSSGVSNVTSGSSGASSGGSGGGSGDDSSGSSGSGVSSGKSSNRFSGATFGNSRGSGGDRSSSRSSGGGSSRSSGGGGETDLGSTSGMGRSGGMSRGGSDFMLVLLNLVKPGSRVKKGDVVAEFDRQYQVRRLDDYKASVAQLDSNIKKLEADLAVADEAHDQLIRVAKSDLDKALLDLKTVEVRSAIDTEKLKLFAEEAQARYKQVLGEVKDFEESQRAQLRAAIIDRDQARIELKRAEANVARMEMKAPIDGIVVMQTMFRGGEFGQIQQGDQIAPGMFFMSIVDPSSMVVNATVNQVDSEMLRLGMKARVRFDAYPDLELPASVIGIAAMTKAGGWRASYVREIPVRLKLDAMEPRVIPDLTASADVVLGVERQAAIAPREAVFYENGGSPVVFLRGPEGWMRKEVEVGLDNNVAVAVRSGLRKGDVVATQRPPQT